jgi:hypothetical protein
LVELLARDSAIGEQRARAFQVGVGLGERGLGLFDRGLRLAEGRLIGTRIDLKQQVAGVHKLSVGERHFVEVAGDPRLDVDAFDGVGAAGEGEVRRLFPLDRPSDRDFRRLGGRWGGRLAAADAGDRQ